MKSKYLRSLNPRYRFNNFETSCATGECPLSYCDTQDCELEYDEYTEYDHLPKFQSSRRAVSEELGSVWHYYHRSWSRQHDFVDKVNPDALLGLHVDTVIARYLPRLRGEYRMPYWVLYLIGIDYAYRDEEGDLVFVNPREGYEHYGYGRRSYYYSRLATYYVCPKSGMIRKYKPKGKWWRPTRQPWHLQHKERYEKRAKRRKEARDRKHHKNEVSYLEMQELFRIRKRKEKALEAQKLIQHGFDPITSFRNH